ncbi:MAG: hypothetical protein WCO48_01190 [Candidatus Taylorbacteria bacterium]
MILIQNWGDVFTLSLNSIWAGVARFIPVLVIALIIFAIGWVLASLIEKLVESLFRALKVDTALKGAGMEDVVKRSGYNLNSGVFVGALVRWFVIIVFLMASLSMLGLDQVNAFLAQIVSYLPNVIVAVLVLLVAAIVASALQEVVVASALAAHSKSAELLGRVAKWSIWIFAIVTALDKLVIIPGLIQIIITPLLAGLALAFGLAFGLGGKDAAARMIEKTASHVLSKE